MNDYGKNIKNARKKAGLTQKELAEASGVAKVTIQQYETGKRQPRLEQLQLIAKALKVRIEVLLGIEELPAEKQVYFPGTPEEHVVWVEGRVLEWTTFHAFLRELGFYPCLDQKDVLNNDEDEHYKHYLYNFRDDKLYIIESEEFFKIEENILSFAKYQISEVLAGKQEVQDKQLISELRQGDFIPRKETEK